MDSRTNRRAFRRRQLYAAVGIDSAERKDRAGVTRNISAGGVLFHSPSQFRLGEELELRIRSPIGTALDRRVKGVVVRVATDTPDTAFPHLTAVAFQEPLEELAED